MKNDGNERQESPELSGQHPWYGGLEFRTLAESIPALVFVGDADGANIYTNAQFQRYTGLNAEELLGDGWIQTIHPDDQQLAEETWLKSWRSGVKYDTKYRFRRFDGEYRWHLVRGAPVRDGNDNILRWIGSCTDVEDLIAHISVQEQSEKILQALGTAPDLVAYAKDAEGQFIYVTGAVDKRIDQLRQSFLGKTLDELAVDKTEVKAIAEVEALVRASGKAHTQFEKWTSQVSGTRHFRSIKVPLPLPDGSVGIAALSVDTTNLVKLEEKYDEIVIHSRNQMDSIPIITWVSDEHGNLTEVNQAWHDHAGFNAGSGIDFKDIITLEAQEKFFDYWQFCVENGEILDIQIELKDELSKTTAERRVLAIPMDRPDAGVSKRFWYGTFS